MVTLKKGVPDSLFRHTMEYTCNKSEALKVSSSWCIRVSAKSTVQMKFIETCIKVRWQRAITSFSIGLMGN